MSGVATVPTQCSAGAFLVIYGRVEVPELPGSKANAFSHSDGNRTIGLSGGCSGNGVGY